MLACLTVLDLFMMVHTANQVWPTMLPALQHRGVFAGLSGTPDWRNSLLWRIDWAVCPQLSSVGRASHPTEKRYWDSFHRANDVGWGWRPVTAIFMSFYSGSKHRFLDRDVFKAFYKHYVCFPSVATWIPLLLAVPCWTSMCTPYSSHQ